MGSLVSVAAQSRRWREIRQKPLVQFDSNCASTDAYPKARLDRIVRATIQREGFEGGGVRSDRAFVFDLNGDRKPEYFVPLVCGGNWQLYVGRLSIKPGKKLGLGERAIYLCLQECWSVARHDHLRSF